MNSNSYLLNAINSVSINHWLHGESFFSCSGLKIPLKGHRAEIINHSPTVPWSDNEWSDDFYKPHYKRLHSIIVAYATKLIPRTTAKVLELCAGDGTLANRILSINTYIKSYTLIERNIKNLDLARVNLKNYIETKQAQIVSCDLTTTDLKDIVTGEFDLVIGSGALTRVVLSAEVAKSVFEQVAAMIKPGGFFILTGHEYSWIDSTTFCINGFDVKNTLYPQTGQHFYVAQKYKANSK